MGSNLFCKVWVNLCLDDSKDRHGIPFFRCNTFPAFVVVERTVAFLVEKIQVVQVRYICTTTWLFSFFLSRRLYYI